MLHLLKSIIFARHLGCLCSLAIVNNDAMNTGVHVSFLIKVFDFPGYIPRSGIVGSYDTSIFSFLSNFHNIFPNGCTNLHSYVYESSLFSGGALLEKYFQIYEIKVIRL